ncbi:MAG: discoidin domain-containing protein [Clostridiaceae bacterium]|nr:discoidin domain-containing protein [Clostridiaceae bacterium]
MKRIVFITFILVIALASQLSVMAANNIDLTTDTTYQKEGTNLLSLNKTVSYSSTYTAASGAWKADALVDGKISNTNPLGWTSDPNDPQQAEDAPVWVQIDLGDVYGIERIVLWPRQDKDPVMGYPVDFTLQLSIDGENWTTVATSTGNTNVDYDAKIFDISKTNARYVRMHCTKRAKDPGSNQWLAQLSEMAVYGGEPAAQSPETSDSAVSILLMTLVIALSACVLRVHGRKVEG